MNSMLGFFKLCMHQLNRNLCVEFYDRVHLNDTIIPQRDIVEDRVVMELEWR
jgi:hypothetical protein